ncbi:hypothetical protein PPYR_13430 [Photinus pyralis]|uniref:Uncharacterized protein n=1 Tax=Photinus pyralis TaxID=7054 RepID=A0A1Y1NKF4_PHOPY|nr:uncharacterized protein LOC116178752 [Photinus pyralis]KAB0793810.1 hypothetical protein PPYR_13430 [Photinus pyralis]
MKAFLRFALYWCVTQVLSAEFPEELLEEHDYECFKKLNLDKNTFSSYFDDRLRLVHLDETGIKLLECVLKDGNYFTPEGKLNKELMVKRIAKWLKFMVKCDPEGKDWAALAAEFYEHCDKIKGDNGVELTKKWNKCLTDKADTIE